MTDKPLFIWYPKCGTCRKALKWLEAHSIDVEIRDIVLENPTEREIGTWLSKSKIPVSGFFNTSGLRYRELGLKETVKSASPQELIRLLASEGKLVKRPVLVAGERVLAGFKEQEWAEALL